MDNSVNTKDSNNLELRPDDQRVCSVIPSKVNCMQEWRDATPNRRTVTHQRTTGPPTDGLVEPVVNKQHLVADDLKTPDDVSEHMIKRAVFVRHAKEVEKT